ncbi:MAG TPA: sigma-54 dependent transcriptional regulator [Gemmataceae bacterium]|nr:sigma-54 dependent transcriptional regulator [Gemmataceae bacterium]
MLEATAKLNTHHWPPYCVPQTAANRENRHAPDLHILEIEDKKADVGAGRLLFIGDATTQRQQQLRQAFPAPVYRVRTAGDSDFGLEQVRSDSPDVIVLDQCLPDGCGLEVYQQIRRINAHVPVVFVARHRRADAAIEVIKHGAYDCLFQPLDLPQLQRVVGEALDVARRMRQPAVAEENEADASVEAGMIGSCPAMAEVYKAVGRVAAQDMPVLITGESGTGKELIARAVHRHGPRAKAPFLALNCAAIPENLLESELFGHEKGAFTGADRRRIGKFEQCHGGTLFLDEIGDMPLSLQAKILRLLQEQSFERLGGNETIRTDVRIITATHRDLAVWSAEGRFRPDLYYRLGVFSIHLPPLRERGDDLAVLVRYFLRRFSRELGREVRAVSLEAMERLHGYSWPGNIRELQSVLKQALLQASGPVLLPAFLPELATERAGSVGDRSAPAADGPGSPALNLEPFIRRRLARDAQDLYAKTRREVDRVLLPRVLEFTRGNQFQAARLLGIARQTLRAKLRDLGLHITQSAEADEA